ncbi:MAG: metal-sulfur cluster assembly factor [Egibacteraceae bacterium]
MTDPLRTWPTGEGDAEGVAGGWGSHAESDEEFEARQVLAGVPVDDDGVATPDAILEALKAVLDPEIGINIVDLGLVYDIETEPGKASVTMTLTSMGCPLTELIHQQCTLVLTRLPGIDEVDVDFTFSPPWTTDMISDDARDELRAMGFAV